MARTKGVDCGYMLAGDDESIWVTAGNISVRVKRTKIGVQVLLCALGCEAHSGNDLGVARATFNNAELVRKEHGTK